MSISLVSAQIVRAHHTTSISARLLRPPPGTFPLWHGSQSKLKGEKSMRAILFLGAALVALSALVAGASAQGVYVGPVHDDYYDGYRSRPPRVYGYGPRIEDRARVEYPGYYRRGGCGTYRFWDGERCVDARYIRP
jgi:hypothetical protein